MNQPLIYKVDFKYRNEVSLLDAVIDIFSKTVLNKELSFRERTVLREYILNGYSSTTKKALKISLGITSENINTLNCTLQKKGFLKQHDGNHRNKVVNDDLMNLKKVFIENQNKKCFLINFVLDDNT